MKKLIRGLHKFQTKIFPEKKLFFEDLVAGQRPEVLFITCSDSRINPNLVTSTGPGDLFIIRNAGNIVPDYICAGGEWATIEFAVYGLNVRHIIVCGHSHCGAIQAVTKQDGIKHIPALYKWIKDNVEPTLKLVEENYKDLDEESFYSVLTQENVLRQIENLKAHSGINSLLLEGKLSLHAWTYKIETGEIFSFDNIDGQFKPIIKI